VALTNIAKDVLKATANLLGYDVVRSERAWTASAAIRRLAAEHEVRSVIDVGASDGRWTVCARQSFPNARFLLIEAQGLVHGPQLEALARTSGNIEIVLAAAGAHRGTIHFQALDNFGGAASEQAFSDRDVIVQMTTIDDEVARRALPPPYFVKLDTHGFERQILEGASSTLPQTSLLQIEAYNFELQPGALRHWELCEFLDHRGFRPVDIADPMRRPRDGVFWQCDLFFARADRPEFASNTYD
jgi:FkbM family methyltransferase